MSEYIYEMIFSGSLKKGGTWGGPECANKLPYGLHQWESIAWLLICILMFYVFDFKSTVLLMHKKHQELLKQCSTTKQSKIFSIFDKIFLFLHFGMWFQILYYKINLKSLVNLLQPCYLTILWEGIAILTNKSISTFMSFTVIPLTLGAIGALAVPATEGLDQPFEEISFFIHHYIMLITPLYLLIRQNFHCLKLSNFQVFLFSNWCCLSLHWMIFSHFDRYFQVNINFFLCPSEGLGAVFDSLPAWAVWPSYRTLVSISLFIAAIPLWYLYIGIASFIKYASDISLSKKLR